jgi:hypothetical protein
MLEMARNGGKQMSVYGRLLSTLFSAPIDYSTPKYTENNVGQCWTCKRCCGQGVVGIKGTAYALPECKTMDALMTRVYKPVCDGFEPEAIK